MVSILHCNKENIFLIIGSPGYNFVKTYTQPGYRSFWSSHLHNFLSFYLISLHLLTFPAPLNSLQKMNADWGSHHLKLLWFKAMVVSVEKKSRTKIAAGKTQRDERIPSNWRSPPRPRKKFQDKVDSTTVNSGEWVERREGGGWVRISDGPG